MRHACLSRLGYLCVGWYNPRPTTGLASFPRMDWLCKRIYHLDMLQKETEMKLIVTKINICGNIFGRSVSVCMLRCESVSLLVLRSTDAS